MDPAERLKHLSEVLNLTDDQKAKVAAILKDDQEKGQAIRNDSSLSREDRRAKMMDLMKDSQTRIRALLTPEQQQKFDAMPRPERGPRDRGASGGPPPGENGPPPPPPAGNP
jgi:Spy/CpxP family protein refolding chaperone